MNKSEPGYITIPELAALRGVSHAITTRENGLGSRANGFKSRDDWNAVATRFGIAPDRLVTVQQVHGDAIVIVDETNYGALYDREADALITKTPGLAIGVETADCVPLLIADPGVPAVAAVHAGWRSTVKQIAAKAVQALEREFGADPGRMVAAFGPAIGPECYEVDEPVMGPLQQAFPFWAEVAADQGAGKWNLDLVEANARVLLAAGLDARNIHRLGMCTCCRRDLFYSFRAEGRTGRMLTAVMIRT